jgi:mono/diheme cytochrome c family protein
MKRLLVVAAVLAAASVASAAEGKAIFGAKCLACHGGDGKGQTLMGKKLRVKDLSASKLTAAQMEAIITKGEEKMPAFAAKLSPEEIKGVAAFVKGGLK